MMEKTSGKRTLQRGSTAAAIMLLSLTIAILALSLPAYAAIVSDAGGSSGCTLVEKKEPDTTETVCQDKCETKYNTYTKSECVTTSKQKCSTETVKVSDGYWGSYEDCEYVPGYQDCYTPSCYTEKTENCYDGWECDDWEGYCWPTGSQTCYTSTNTVCPPKSCTWVSGYDDCYDVSYYVQPVYESKTNCYDEPVESCTPVEVKEPYEDCKNVCTPKTVPGKVTYELSCPPPAGGSVIVSPIGVGGAEDDCYSDCVCSTFNDCCSGYSPASDPACAAPKQTCTPGAETARSCTGCKLATLTMCNSQGTGTYEVKSQYAPECTAGCPTPTPTPVPTPTPAPKPVCGDGKCAGGPDETCSSCEADCGKCQTTTVPTTPTPTPTPVPKPTPNSATCLKTECSGNSVVVWGYDIWADDCYKVSTTACGAGETCNSATAKCEKTVSTCNTLCSGDSFIKWHLDTKLNACMIDATTDCAAQGKKCDVAEGGCYTPVSTAKTCADLGCPSGYTCSYATEFV